jgi:DNA polymerase-1
LEKILDKKIKDTNEATLELIDHPVISAILDYREAAKQVSTYGTEFYAQHNNPQTGRIHSSFHQLGRTDSGRYASKEPNLQNIPAIAEYRSAFVAQYPGWKIVGADYSGFELVLLAEFSQEPEFMKALKNNVDLHSHMASLVTGKTVARKGDNYFDPSGNLKTAKRDINVELRKTGKAINFGIAYGMGPTKLAHKLKITFQEAKEVLEVVWKKIPAVKAFMDDRVNEAIASECVRSFMDNRLRWIKGFDLMLPGQKAHACNIARNMSLQSGNASVLKVAMHKVYEEIRNKNWQKDCLMISTIHDEILLECREAIAEEVKEMLETCMIEAAKIWVKTVPVKAGAYIADHWIKD